MDQDTVFWQLYFAIVARQGGTTNLRTIMASLFAPDTADDEIAQLYSDAQANPDEAQTVADGVANAGLYLPDAPVAVAPSEPAPVEPVVPVAPIDPAPVEPVEHPPVDPVETAN